MNEPIYKRAITANILQTMGTVERLTDGLIQIPIGKMLDQVQYLQQHVLPQAKEKLGEESESYRFYKSLVDSLLWAINIQNRFDILSTRYSREKYFGEILKKDRDELEKELMKFTTLEEHYSKMSSEHYLQTITKPHAIPSSIS